MRPTFKSLFFIIIIVTTLDVYVSAHPTLGRGRLTKEPGPGSSQVPGVHRQRTPGKLSNLFSSFKYRFRGTSKSNPSDSEEGINFSAIISDPVNKAPSGADPSVSSTHSAVRSEDHRPPSSSIHESPIIPAHHPFRSSSPPQSPAAHEQPTTSSQMQNPDERHDVQFSNTVSPPADRASRVPPHEIGPAIGSETHPQAKGSTLIPPSLNYKSSDPNLSTVSSQVPQKGVINETSFLLDSDSEEERPHHT